MKPTGAIGAIIVTRERVALYVDGLNLYYGMLSGGMTRYLWLDAGRLAERLSLPNQRVVAAKYFTTRLVELGVRKHLARPQGIHLQALQSTERVTVIEGEFFEKVGVCHSCGKEWTTYEEKMTDVNIGIELVCDAEDDAFDTALLASADGDLTGPVERVLSRHPRKRIVVGFPPRRWSESLRNAASAHFKIGRTSLRASQLPDKVVSENGYVLQRPGEWSRPGCSS